MGFLRKKKPSSFGLSLFDLVMDRRACPQVAGSVNADEVPPVPEALAALAQLNDRFDGRVHLLDHMSPANHATNMNWLRRHGFFAPDALREGQVHFCTNPIQLHGWCFFLDITHFADTRLSDLKLLPKDIVSCRYLYLGGEEPVATRPHPGILPVQDWDDLLHDVAERV